MSAAALESLAAELGRLKAQGHTAVALDALMPYVDGLLASARAADPEAERQRIQLNFERQMAQHRTEQESRREGFKAVIEAGQSALRTLLVINGGAAVAVLAFLGNVLSKSESSALAAVAGMNRAMASFAAGVALAALGFIARYASQASYGGSFWPKPDDSRRWGNHFRNAAITCALVSLGVFLVGIVMAYRAMG